MAAAAENSSAEAACDCSVDDIRDKYTACGAVVNAVLAATLQRLRPGATVLEICQKADEELHAKLQEVYGKKKGSDGEPIPRGIAFPCCVNVNECIRNYSPLEDDSHPPLQKGDVASVELGGHIDGYIATAAHTVVVGEEGEVNDQKIADLMLAGYKTLEVMARCVRPGGTNAETAQAMHRAVESFGCNLVTSMVSYEYKQHVIDGAKCILPAPGLEEKQPPCTFGQYEVYGLNVFVTTGEGKPRDNAELRPSVFRREISVSTLPKSQAGRAVIDDVNRRFPCLPFSARAVGEPKTRRMALTEGQRTGALTAIPMLYAKPGELVAHFGCTLMLTKVPRRIAGADLDEKLYRSEKKIEDEAVLKLLQRKLKC